MTDHYDALETRDPGRARSATCSARLPAADRRRRMARAGLGAASAGVDAGARSTSRAALAQLPVMRKSDLPALQKAERRPSAASSPIAAPGFGPRCSRRPGPIFEPEGTARDYWRTARALFAAGFRAGDIVHNCFSYHLTPGGFIMESGAHALGCTVIPGGHRQDRAAGRGASPICSRSAMSARRTS